jgi:hypothetical protein
MHPIKESEVIAFTLVTYKREISGKGINKQGCPSLYFNWADTSSYFKATLVKKMSGKK